MSIYSGDSLRYLDSFKVKYKQYLPLFVIILVSFLCAWAIAWGKNFVGVAPLMTNWMGLFLVIFSMFKLFDLQGFAKGFEMYDLVAQRSKQYALAYPFIELALGLAFLSDFMPLLTSIFTGIIMSIGAVGVIRTLMAGMDVQCACLGTVLKVPLSTVTLIEDVAMALMAFGVAFSA